MFIFRIFGVYRCKLLRQLGGGKNEKCSVRVLLVECYFVVKLHVPILFYLSIILYTMTVKLLIRS